MEANSKRFVRAITAMVAVVQRYVNGTSDAAAVPGGPGCQGGFEQDLVSCNFFLLTCIFFRAVFPRGMPKKPLLACNFFTSLKLRML